MIKDWRIGTISGIIGGGGGINGADNEGGEGIVNVGGNGGGRIPCWEFILLLNPKFKLSRLGGGGR